MGRAGIGGGGGRRLEFPGDQRIFSGMAKDGKGYLY